MHFVEAGPSIPARTGRASKKAGRLLSVVAVVLAITATHAFGAGAAPSTTPSPTAQPAPEAARTTSPNSITFGIQPANAKQQDSRPFFSYGVTPGATLTDHFAVINYSLNPATFSVYPTDALNTPEGGLAFLTGAVRPVDAGSWITLPSGAYTLKLPGRKSSSTPPVAAIVPFRVNVPAEASPGDHVGGMLAVLSTVSKDKNGANIRLDQRTASRIYIRVAGPVHPRMAIQNLKVSYSAGSPLTSRGTARLTYTVRNTGNVKLGGRQLVRISGAAGSWGPSAALVDIPLLLPKNSINVSVTVPRIIASFRMTAKVTIVPLRLEGDVDPGLPKQIVATTHFWAVPWIFLAALLLMVVLIGLWWWRWRGRRKPAGQASPIAGGRTPLPEKVRS